MADLCKRCTWNGSIAVCTACKKARDGSPVPVADMERAARHASVEKKKSPRLDTFSGKRVRITVHSKRNRLCDADGISAKALIDGFVLAGVFKNDSPEFVESVGYSQEKSKAEETIITVEAT